jgi:hypothetical protein
VIRVVGVLGGNTPEQVATAPTNLGPGAVPLIDGHGGSPLGWLDAMTAHGSDLWFVGRVDDLFTAQRLRRGPVAVSAEMQSRGVLPLPGPMDGGTVVFYSVDDPVPPSPWFRGTIGHGWTVTAVALLLQGETPARPGSAAWAPWQDEVR